MKFIVNVYISRTGKKVACIMGKTSLQDYILTFDSVAVCLALNMTREQVLELECGEYEITERR